MKDAHVKTQILVWLLVLVFFSTSLRARFFSYLQVESGFSRFKNQKQYVLLRPKLEMGQKLPGQKFFFNWAVAYQPEIFDFPSLIFSQRLRGRFVLNARFGKLTSEMRFRFRNQYFKIETDHYSWQSSDVSMDFNYRFSRTVLGGIQGLLWYRDTNDFDRQKLNAAVLRLSIRYFFKTIVFRGAFHHETYTIQPAPSLSTPAQHGQRNGVLVSLERNQNVFFTATYQLLWHRHPAQNSTRPDHQINILLGFWLTRQWSLFLFGAYNRISIDGNLTENALLYTPINSANRFHVKIGRDLTARTELYFRVGYEQEKLIRSAEQWQYWQLVGGLRTKLK